MKIVIFGLSISSSWGNGHATIWRGLCKALAARGHRVIFFERDVSYYAQHRDMPALEGGQLVLFESWAQVAGRARSELADADVGIITSYCPDAAAALLELGASRALRVFYDLDTPVTFARLLAGESVGYIGKSGLSDYELVLSYTGGAALGELSTRLGARLVGSLYGAADTALHRPVADLPARFSALSYLGTYSADRQDALEKLFLEPARCLPRARFVLGGAQYPADFPWGANIYFKQHVPPPEHPAFFCSARFTLNVTRQAMREAGYCPSGRLFEAAACGVPVISDGWEGLEEFFEPGREILIAANPAEALAALQMSEADRLAMGRRARQRVLADHTCEARALRLEKLLAIAQGGGATGCLED